jgi:hypothetical protein
MRRSHLDLSFDQFLITERASLAFESYVYRRAGGQLVEQRDSRGRDTTSAKSSAAHREIAQTQAGPSAVDRQRIGQAIPSLQLELGCLGGREEAWGHET